MDYLGSKGNNWKPEARGLTYSQPGGHCSANLSRNRATPGTGGHPPWPEGPLSQKPGHFLPAIWPELLFLFHILRPHCSPSPVKPSGSAPGLLLSLLRGLLALPLFVSGLSLPFPSPMAVGSGLAWISVHPSLASCLLEPPLPPHLRVLPVLLWPLLPGL